MNWLVILVLAGCAFNQSYAGAPNEVLIDLLIENQLIILNNWIKSDKLTTLTLGDYTLPGNKVTARGVRMSDLSTLKATDHAYVWTSPGNSIDAQAFVGLKNMTIEIDSLTFNDQTFPATFSVGVNSLGFHQKTNFQEDNCQQIYSQIAFYKLDDVKIYTNNPSYNGQDISQFVQMEILPFANNLMQQKVFLDWVQEYFDTCNYMKTQSSYSNSSH